MNATCENSGHIYAGQRNCIMCGAENNTPQSPQTCGDKVAEIRERWKDRSWPNIGYFVHGQALSDIHYLLNLIKPQDDERTDWKGQPEL